ncbi:23S rRNA (guanosine(2251)-2'-O)-methyltransferase RlmB, partial [Candidatus Saccharibacteria bacterium]|nr:23S rRNA (guanosine(2251)-2'-O)-methyltransferase RlmB [Calditrichia bacterium]NIV71467.1 23S rRNA (guanosine(2251)-2'-O)-methyltransferase RlmB [Calditrichia bacterium]NIV98005.1 23S rRNA (guanosine(2251)-2'-O)-methyltransferase RlmB [Candidatus Saccharibacteria bacterium]NIW78301.1 23S rRNA (guanosine(2251)-2'-O)-methyltransferase RlmB [Calditrichia bacterium]
VLKGFRFNVTASTVYGKQILGKTRFKAPTALVLGGEAQGVSPRLINVADRSVRIWRYGQAESLNVAVAG